MNRYLEKIAEEAEKKKSNLGRNVAIGGGALLAAALLAAAISGSNRSTAIKGVAESVSNTKRRPASLARASHVREGQSLSNLLHSQASDNATRMFNEQNHIFNQQVQMNHAIHHSMF